MAIRFAVPQTATVMSCAPFQDSSYFPIWATDFAHTCKEYTPSPAPDLSPAVFERVLRQPCIASSLLTTVLCSVIEKLRLVNWAPECAVQWH